MDNPKFVCFEISAVSHDWDAFSDMYEEDPEQNRDDLIDECCSVDVLTQVWAANEEEALEKAARNLGFQDSGKWLDFLNLGDDCISLRIDPTPEPDMELHFYYNNPV